MPYENRMRKRYQNDGRKGARKDDLPREVELNGRPALEIYTGEGRDGRVFTFTLGLPLCAAVVENYEAILDFLKANDM